MKLVVLLHTNKRSLKIKGKTKNVQAKYIEMWCFSHIDSATGKFKGRASMRKLGSVVLLGGLSSFR
jgi:hypothetical protein